MTAQTDMNQDPIKKIKYSILDPTGNITALVESEVPSDRRQETASMIMKAHPEIEQVGFVSGDKLTMAGGEFCGNASMCAAALKMIREAEAGTAQTDESVEQRKPRQFRMTVSGVPEAVTVRIAARDRLAFEAAVHMPPARYIEYRYFSYRDLNGTLGVVALEGITHIMIESDSAFYALKDRKDEAEEAVRSWCSELEADGIGLIFMDQSGTLIPLVWIRSAGTMFWEQSCASGTAAAGMYLADRICGPIDEVFREPGGNLRVMSDPLNANTWLLGSVRFLNEYNSL